MALELDLVDGALNVNVVLQRSVVKAERIESHKKVLVFLCFFFVLAAQPNLLYSCFFVFVCVFVFVFIGFVVCESYSVFVRELMFECT